MLLLTGPWFAALAAKVLGFLAAIAMAIPFFDEDWIRRSLQQAKSANADQTAKGVLRKHAERLSKLAAEWMPPRHIFLMRCGLTCLAVAFAIEFALLLMFPNR